MSFRKLKFTVKFLKEETFTLDLYVSHATKFFSNIKQEKFEHIIISKDVKQCTDGFNFDSSLYEINFIIECRKVKSDSDVTNFCSAIQKQWCNAAKKDKYLHWLMPDNNNFISSNYNNQYGNAKASDFSFGTTPNMKTFVKQYTFSQKRWVSTILCSFSHLQRHFSLYISNLHTPECNLKGEMGHKIVITYDSLIRIIANTDPSKETAELFFHMEHPPHFFVSHANPVVENPNELEKLFKNKISKAKELENGCDKFERTFNLGCKCNNTLCGSKRVGKCLVLKISIGDKFQTRWLIEQLIQKCAKKTEICFTSLETMKLNYDLKEFKRFPWISNKYNVSETEEFNCEYAWKVAHSRSLYIQHEISLKNQINANYVYSLMEKLSHYAQKNPTAVAKALFYIADMVDKGTMFMFQQTFEKKFEYFCTFIELIPIPKGMCYVRRVLLTPSRVLFLQPYEHFDNRIIRNFGVEYMLRVSVQDDNFSKLTFAVQYNSNKEKMVHEVVGNILSSGLVIGSRRYQVLASSSSQLREHGMWLYAKDLQNNSAYTIRKWMGDFSAIKNVAKYMARMGQCLSSTEEAVQICLNSKSEILLNDIKSPNGRYIFSDGIGVISSILAKEVRSVLIQNKYSGIEECFCYSPMAFQIRYKGCKGMVAEDPTLPDRVIGIRPSMKKFECDTSDQLEIVKTSAPRRLFLNKHLITIMEQMGIPKETFLDLQSDMMLNLLDSLVDENCAASLLSYNLSMNFPYRNLVSSGFSLTTEPFFRSLLLAFFKASIAKLRSSMRIAIPEKYGRNMLGVLDETGKLKYGQVFIQYSESTYFPNSPLKILKGPVIVTKNPSLHPGDVRRLMAVDVPELNHMKDCIVFPANGRRPHPDEMAGSDLDGDEFVAIWYPPLIFKRGNAKPMDYPVYEEIPLPHKIEVSDMVEFFCHYIQNDCIGSFAHAHLVWADKLEDGIFSNKCMQIAERYPYVLDFAKQGTTKYLKKSERPDQYPDFMQKGLTANSYHSKKALGSLYRTSRVLDACSSKINLTIQSSTFDVDLSYPGWEKYRSSAEKHKQDYTNMILEILNKYSLKSEAEAFSGFVELETSKKWRQECSNTVKVVKCYIENTMFTFRQVFLKEVNEEMEKLSLDATESRSRKYQRASAWYMCLYGTEGAKIFSFPWILSDILAELKSHKKTLPYPINNFLLDIDTDLRNYISSDIFESDGDQCFCRLVLKATVISWLSNSGLNIWSNGASPSCQNCCKRIIMYFLSNSKMVCCSVSQEMCKCSESCSPTKLIIKFLKFFIKKTTESIGKCEESCDGFIPRNLQELSLQTLAYLVITRNIKFLGFQFNTVNHTKNALSTDVNGNMFEEEGDPIKIPVKTDLLKKLIEENLEDVTTFLQKNSGVKHIVLRPEADLHDNNCLIVNSVGKNFERWNLEAILLDPNFTNNLKSALNL